MQARALDKFARPMHWSASGVIVTEGGGVILTNSSILTTEENYRVKMYLPVLSPLAMLDL